MADASTKELRSAPYWRALHAVFPVGSRMGRAVRWLSGDHAFVRIPWGAHKLTLPGAWLREESSASAPVYQGPVVQNPEFFDVLAPHVERMSRGAIVDVGANIGIYTLNFRALSDAPIYCFEPDPFIFEMLCENIRSNGLARATPLNLACGDANGTLAFARSINGNVVPTVSTAPTPTADTIQVPVVRLDDRLADARPIAMLKIDCEGFEWQILNGTREILARDRPICFIELHPKLIGGFGHALGDVCDVLRATHDLQFWDVSPSQRSSSRVARVLGRYRAGAVRLRDEGEMLRVSATEPRPDQLFLLALPKGATAGA